MRTIYLINDLINDTPTTKVLKFRFSLSGEKENDVNFKTEKINLIEWWKWFTSVYEAEQYLEKL